MRKSRPSSNVAEAKSTVFESKAGSIDALMGELSSSLGALENKFNPVYTLSDDEKCTEKSVECETDFDKFIQRTAESIDGIKERIDMMVEGCSL